MKHPKFIQIMTSALGGAQFHLVALDENGEVWVWNSIKQAWLILGN